MRSFWLLLLFPFIIISCFENERDPSTLVEKSPLTIKDRIHEAVLKEFPNHEITSIQYENLDNDTIKDAIVISQIVCDKNGDPEVFCRIVSLLIGMEDSTFTVHATNNYILDKYDKSLGESDRSIECIGDSLKFTSLYGGCSKTLQSVWFVRKDEHWILEKIQTDGYSCLEQDLNPDGSISVSTTIKRRKDFGTITFSNYNDTLTLN